MAAAEAAGGGRHHAGASLHGDTAAKRQAVTELLFFASVGDVGRCQRICNTWRIDPLDESCRDYDKRTPLHLAASEGCYSVVEWLLQDCGVDVNPVDRFKRTPLEDAVRGDYGEVVQLLASKGGKVTDKEGALIDLNDSGLAGNVRIFGEWDPEWEVDPKQIQFGAKVGEGEFGVVYRASYLGTPVAVKVLKDNNAVALGDFRTEMNVLQKLHHPHCVQFFGAVTKTSPYMIVTEFMGCGSLADLFRKTAAPSTRRCVQLALECARGIAYLHNRQPFSVIHRDLKPANLMIGGGPSDSAAAPAARDRLLHELGVVKIADFGLSKSLKLQLGRGQDAAGAAPPMLNPGSSDGGAAPPPPPPAAAPAAARAPSLAAALSKEGSGSRRAPRRGGAGGAFGASPSFQMTGETGSYRYMAPEVFRHEPYNHKVDVYSFAMIMYQLLEGVPPFWAMDAIEAARAAATGGARPEWGTPHGHGRSLPPKLVALVEACWAGDAGRRPEFVAVIGTLNEVLAELPYEGYGGKGGGGGGDGCVVM